MNIGFFPNDVEYKSGCGERGEQTEPPIQNISFYNPLCFFLLFSSEWIITHTAIFLKVTFILALLGFCTVS